eukprot:TRINITY_DN5220_c0_g1_i1.p1 TRINITY_DN5220_c0_g1~~TRINITY_DN5220_c0_g1_i1.p1  ORF type:complete len:795 (+),score=83.26 TRINITY_DN5220_c0_g1_i1:100-2484(+)
MPINSDDDQLEPDARNAIFSDGGDEGSNVPAPVFAFDDVAVGGGGGVSVPLPFVIEVIEKRITKSSLYTDLIVYVPFVVMFCFFAYGGRDITGAYYTVRALRDTCMGNEISPFSLDGLNLTEGDFFASRVRHPNDRPSISFFKTYEDVATYENVASLDDWYNWLDTVLVPNVFNSYPADEEPTATRTIQGTNLLVGALRFRTIRSTDRSCTPDSEIFNITGDEFIPCYGEISGGENVQKLFGFQNPLMPIVVKGEPNELYTHSSCGATSGGQYISGFMALYHCGGYVVDVPFSKSLTDVRILLARLKEQPFLHDSETRFASVEFFVYTPATNAFTSVKLFIEVSPSGAVLPSFQFRAFHVWTESRNIGQSVFDFFFFVYVLYYSYKFAKDWFIFHKTKGKILAFIFNLWNLLEFCNLVIFMVVFAMRWVWWDISKQSGSNTFPFGAKYPKDLDLLLTLFSTTVYSNSVNVTLVFLKILKFMRLNPRLGILTLSIGEKKSQLLGILILFAWSVLAFALAGMSLFGSTMWEFHSLDTSYTTLLRMLVGDFSRLSGGGGDSMEDGIYPAMRRENRVLAGAYFWCYVILVFFILLNMIIAVLAEGFAAISSQYSATSLADELRATCESIARSCSHERLWARYELFRKGLSITDCLTTVKQNIEEHHQLVKGEDRDIDDNETYLTRESFKMYMSAAEYKTLGTAYVADLWYDIVLAYKNKGITAEILEEEDLQNAVETGTSRVTDPVEEIFRDILYQSKEFEKDLNKFLDEVKVVLKDGQRPALEADDPAMPQLVVVPQ